MKIYLAGPDVFYPNALEVGRRKQQLCSNNGAIGLFPLDNEVDHKETDAAYTIYLANKKMMDEADCAIINLTPFRGPSADAGTVFEMGYMIGIGKPVFCYTVDPRPYERRVAREYSPTMRNRTQGLYTDCFGHFIEEFGLHDNLMIDGAIREQGSTMVVGSFFHDNENGKIAINTFERCLKSCVDNMNFRTRMP